MPRAVLLALLLALPVAADAPRPASPTPRLSAPADKPRPTASPATPSDEGELDEYVPSESVPADAWVAFPHDI